VSSQRFSVSELGPEVVEGRRKTRRQSAEHVFLNLVQCRNLFLKQLLRPQTTRKDFISSHALSKKRVGMKIATEAIAWIEDSRSAPLPLSNWLKEFRDDYRARRYYLNEISGSTARMHAYYVVRFLSQAGKVLFRKGSQ